jgi:fatty-acyl-CoA synthase
MAAYKYPRSVEFVDELPKNGTGEILWRELREEEQRKMAETR